MQRGDRKTSRHLKSKEAEIPSGPKPRTLYIYKKKYGTACTLSADTCKTIYNILLKRIYKHIFKSLNIHF